jgi:hypothetical protein
METSGVMGNRLLLGLRQVTATRQLKADHSLTVKATKPRMQQKYNGKKRRAWTSEEIREVVWSYMYWRHFTENYKKMYEIWR